MLAIVQLDENAHTAGEDGLLLLDSITARDGKETVYPPSTSNNTSVFAMNGTAINWWSGPVTSVANASVLMQINCVLHASDTCAEEVFPVEDSTSVISDPVAMEYYIYPTQITLDGRLIDDGARVDGQSIALVNSS